MAHIASHDRLVQVNSLPVHSPSPSLTSRPRGPRIVPTPSRPSCAATHKPPPRPTRQCLPAGACERGPERVRAAWRLPWRAFSSAVCIVRARRGGAAGSQPEFVGVSTRAVQKKTTWTYLAVLFFGAGSHANPAGLDKACSCVVFPVFFTVGPHA